MWVLHRGVWCGLWMLSVYVAGMTYALFPFRLVSWLEATEPVTWTFSGGKPDSGHVHQHCWWSHLDDSWNVLQSSSLKQAIMPGARGALPGRLWSFQLAAVLSTCAVFLWQGDKLRDFWVWRDCGIKTSAQRGKVKHSEENSQLVLSFLPGRVLNHSYHCGVFFLLLINVP